MILCEIQTEKFQNLLIKINKNAHFNFRHILKTFYVAITSQVEEKFWWNFTKIVKNGEYPILHLPTI